MKKGFNVIDLFTRLLNNITPYHYTDGGVYCVVTWQPSAGGQSEYGQFVYCFM